MMSPFTPLTPEVRLDSKAWLEGLEYELVTDERVLRAWVETLVDGQPVGADFETDRLNRFTKPVPVGFSASNRDRQAIYVPMHHLTRADLNVPEELVRDLLIELERRQIPTVWWNYVYDGSVIVSNWRVDLLHWQDAMVARWVYDPTQHEIGLKSAARRVLGIPVLDFDTVTTGRKFQELAPQEAVVYAGADADNTLQLWNLTTQDAWFKAQHLVYHQIERPFTLVLRDELVRGVATDVRAWERISSTLGDLNDDDIPSSGMLKASYDTVMGYAGGTINLNSPPQVGQLLQRLGVGIEQQTKSGAVATGKDVLAKYDHPVCKAITRYRELVAAKRNTAEKILDACRHFNSPWIRFPFKQCGAPTGRMACGGDDYEAGFVPVNGQGIPDPKKRKDLPDQRAPFTAAPVDDPDAKDWVWVAIDFSQFQLRIAANLSGEVEWIDAFARGDDIHKINAKLAYKVEKLSDVTDEQRNGGKTMGFAVLFQAGDETVASHGNIPLAMASQLVKTFKDGTPILQRYIENLKQIAAQHGYVETLFGRRRPLDKYFKNSKDYKLIGQGERYAANTPIQGTEADLFKIACTRVLKLCRERGWSKLWEPENSLVRQVLWVHDELDLCIHRSVLEEALPLIITTMQIAVPGWRAPLKVDAGVGATWSEAKANG
jgi:DNA polymerase-1